MDLAAIQKLDLSSFRVNGTTIDWNDFNAPAGKEHYKLLSWCASQFNGADIFDIGTHRGPSAIALASGNRNNHIYSFDIEHLYPLATIPNVSYHLDNLLTESGRAQWKDKLLASPFIFLDIDPHEGTREYEFYCWLKAEGYSGFLICDDIWYFKEMRDNFWYRIPASEKVDVTKAGHWSGTGIVHFANTKTMPFTPPTLERNWTVVTAYFDLTKMPDASAPIKDRPATHYLANARATMATEQNLMVFCEPESVEALKALRPAWLLESHTKFVAMSFEDFPMTQFRAKIQENRRRNPYSFDERNTASYYLLCMSRYAMLKQAIAENPFQSTHFAWLNVCIERMGWRNIVALDEVWEQNREKFSTCYIDYQPEALIRNTHEYFRWGRCGMCSGFFTGSAEYMGKFCEAIEAKFLQYLEMGYGHADEQLFSAVYFENRDIFQVYHGDYREMVTNYVEPRDKPYEPVRLLCTHSFAAGDYPVCEDGCRAVWNAWKKGVAVLDAGQLQELVRLYRLCRRLQGKGEALP